MKFKENDEIECKDYGLVNEKNHGRKKIKPP